MIFKIETFTRDKVGRFFFYLGRFRVGNMDHLMEKKAEATSDAWHLHGTFAIPPSANWNISGSPCGRSRRSSERCIAHLAALKTDFFFGPDTSLAISTRRYRISRSTTTNHVSFRPLFFFQELESEIILCLLQLKSQCYVSVKNITLLYSRFRRRFTVTMKQNERLALSINATSYSTVRSTVEVERASTSIRSVVQYKFSFPSVSYP